jgi:amino acid permease
MLGSALSDILEWEGDLKDFYENSFCCEYKIIIIYSIATLFLFTTLYSKNSNKTLFTSIFGLIFMVFPIVTILVQSFWYIPYYWENTYNENDPNTWINYFDVSKGFNRFQIFRTFAVLFFASNFHGGILPITNELKKNDLTRKNKVLNWTLISYGVLFLSVGIIGFLSFPINTPNIFLQRETIFQDDHIMDIGKLFVIFSLLIKFPSNYITYKLHLFSIIFNKSEVSFSTELITKLLSIYSAATISFFYTWPENYVDIIGGICSINICVVFPCK